MENYPIGVLLHNDPGHISKNLKSKLADFFEKEIVMVNLLEGFIDGLIIAGKNLNKKSKQKLKHLLG